MSNADTLEETVAPMANRDPRRIIFDLSGLRFRDSAGIAVLVNLAAAVDVVLRNPSPAVRRVVELSGLTGVLAMEP
jgi:anti-anti-sigma factor